MARFKVAAAATAGLTLLDLSAGTESNTGMKAGATSLGTTSTMVVAATHGVIDNPDFNCYVNLQQIAEAPAGKRTLHAVMTVTTAPSEDPDSSYAALRIVVAPDASLADDEGYHVGLAQTGSATQRLAACKRVGEQGAATAPDLGAGTYTIELFVYFNGTLARGAFGVGRGADDELPLSELTAATGTFTNVWLGVTMDQKSASPSSVVTWTAVQLKYEWV